MIKYKNKQSKRWSFGIDFGFALMAFGYQVGVSFDITEWHLTWDYFPGVGFLVCLGPLYFDALDATQYDNEENNEIKDLEHNLELAHEAQDQLYVKLAACGITARGEWGHLEPTQVEYSDAQNCIADLFQKYTQALKEVEMLRNKLVKVVTKKVVKKIKARRK